MRRDSSMFRTRRERSGDLSEAANPEPQYAMKVNFSPLTHGIDNVSREIGITVRKH
jgi:hypothetical protein